MRVWKEAPKARPAGNESSSHSISRNRASVNPGLAKFYANVVYEKACFHVVRAVNHQIRGANERLGVFGIELVCHGFYGYRGIYRAQSVLCRRCLGLANILFGEKSLPLKIRQIHNVAVDYFHVADASTRKQICRYRACAAAPDDKDGRRRDAPLAFCAYCVKYDVPGISFVIWKRRHHLTPPAFTDLNAIAAFSSDSPKTRTSSFVL
jgi:hypothetical protein